MSLSLFPAGYRASGLLLPVMNQPRAAEGNWRWRCTDEMLSAPGFDSLKTLTRASARAGAAAEATS